MFQEQLVIVTYCISAIKNFSETAIQIKWTQQLLHDVYKCTTEPWREKCPPSDFSVFAQSSQSLSWSQLAREMLGA